MSTREQAERAYLAAREQTRQVLLEQQQKKQALVAAWMEEHYPGVPYLARPQGYDLTILLSFEGQTNRGSEILTQLHSYLQALEASNE